MAEHRFWSTTTYRRQMRVAPTVLLFVVHAASALQPVSVQRRAVLGGAAAALVVTPQEKARAAGLEQFKPLPVHK